MKKSKLTVIAKITARKDKIRETKEALAALVGPTHLETGCLDYDLHQSQEDPRLFFFYENWTGKDKLDVHLKSPHLKMFGQIASGLLDAPVEIYLLNAAVPAGK